MINVDFDFSGLEHELRDEVRARVREEAETRARSAAATVRCPEHGEALRELSIAYDGGGQAIINATPCCDAIDAELGRAINAEFEREDSDCDE